ELVKAMPKKAILKAVNRPKVMYKKDGTLSSHGATFEEKRKANCQPEDVQTFNVIDGYEDGNPGSHVQVKDWLYSLGWQPCTFDYKREPNGDTRTIPQVREDGELTESVVRLADVDPAVKVLEGLSIVQHRIGVVKSFLKALDSEGYVFAGVHGLTNTLRFKHVKPLANLPGVDKAYGKEIRGLLIAPEGYVLCGSDMDSLEQNTKMHYMTDYDPEYVATQQTEDFDAHLDLAKFAGAVTQEQIEDHNKTGSLKSVRKAYKVTNYSATYGIKPLGLSRRGGFSVKEAEELLDAFWKRNWALEAIAKDTKTKRTRDGQMWLYNPVSKFWYSLRHEKDKFSTLNQSTGVYCFDTWLGYCISQGLDAIGQFHDEAIFLVKRGDGPKTSNAVYSAMNKTNNKLKLNVKLSTDPEFGDNYSEIH
ncbi:MAG: DNA polymerase, partial [Epibacterium sp.]|nr:DNA polymerase [Epibacterium sp.]